MRERKRDRRRELERNKATEKLPFPKSGRGGKNFQKRKKTIVEEKEKKIV